MKNIAAPNIQDYPAVASDLTFSLGDYVHKGDRLCVLTLKSGRKIAINAPVSGEIKLLMIRDGREIGGSQMLAAIDETVILKKPEATPEPPNPSQPEATIVQKPHEPHPRATRKPMRRQNPPPKTSGKQINFFLWQGWGWLVPIVFCASVLAVFWIMEIWLEGDAELLVNSRWLQGLTFLTPAVVVGLFGLWTNKRKSAIANHRVSKFLFLRSEYWAAPLVIIAIGGMVFIDMRLKERAETRAALSELLRKVGEAAREESEAIKERNALAENAKAKAFREAKYSFTLCNESNITIWAAIAIRDHGNSEHMRMRSWFSVPRGGCLRPFVRRFEDAQQTAVYYHAFSPDRATWGGRSGDAGTIDFCLSSANKDFPINSQSSAQKRCRNKSHLRTFEIRTISRERPKLKISLE